MNNLVKNDRASIEKRFPRFDEIMGMAGKELGKKRTREQEAKEQAEASLKGLKGELDSLLRVPPAALKTKSAPASAISSAARERSRAHGELHEKL